RAHLAGPGHPRGDAGPDDGGGPRSQRAAAQYHRVRAGLRSRRRRGRHPRHHDEPVAPDGRGHRARRVHRHRHRRARKLHRGHRRLAAARPGPELRRGAPSRLPHAADLPRDGRRARAAAERPLRRGGAPVRRLPIALLAAALILAPLGVGRVYSAYYLNLLTWILIFALFAAALDLALGYGGLVSFGHAGFFGAGAYGAALALRHVAFSLWAALLIGIAAGALLAVVVGYFAVHSRGVYMAMLTFAFAQLLYEIAIKWVALTGGSDGLPGIGRPRVGIWRIALDLSDKRHMYWLVLAFVMLGYALARRVVESPFGRALVAVRESEERARAIGIDVTRHRRVALVFSGALAGLAGSLFAVYQNFVSPELLFFALSGEVVVIALLGGLGTLYGSLVGAIIAIGLREVLSTYTDN